MITELNRWDFFIRTETNHRTWAEHKERPANCYSLSFPTGTTLAAALEFARANGMPQGTHRSGCFEVQTPEGIYSHVNDCKIDLSTPAKAAKVIFTTWAELDAADNITFEPEPTCKE
jgi:hypothetical protein